MDSQDSPSVIPCSAEEIPVEAEVAAGVENGKIQESSIDEDASESLLANATESDVNVTSTADQSNAEKSSIIADGVSNSIDMESSEINPMSSTRIEQDNSVSMLNEGFMIDSASLSLSAVNDDSRKTMLEANEGEEEIEMDTAEPELEEIDGESEEINDAQEFMSNDQIGSDEEETDDATDYPVPQFPLARVKKIMAICAAAEDDEGEDTNTSKKKKDKGKGNMMMTKEAIYLTSLATEHFISVIGELAGNVTTSSKKKTLTLEHLKRALSDTDAFAFLEGCFQPSLIIGD